MHKAKFVSNPSLDFVSFSNAPLLVLLGFLSHNMHLYADECERQREREQKYSKITSVLRIIIIIDQSHTTI